MTVKPNTRRAKVRAKSSLNIPCARQILVHSQRLSHVCATRTYVWYPDRECVRTCTVCSQVKDKPCSRPVPVPGSADFRCPYISFSYDDRSSISSELPLRMNETSDVIIESLSRRPGHFRPLWFLLLGPRCLRSITNYGNPFLI